MSLNEHVIKIEELAKTYNSGWRRRHRVEALRDLDLEVDRGDIFAFLGPNGAGKTTTINLLMGFLQPTRGRVAVFSSPPSDRRVRARIGYLPENYAFYSFLTAPQLLRYFARLFRIPTQTGRCRIEQLLRQLGLWEAREKRIGQYSRGMRQRLGIIQALLNEPELLILDEPTSGFDPLGRRMVRDLLIDLKRRGATIFLCSHILSEVETVCDRVAIIDKGRLVKQGALAEVIGSQTGYEVVFTDPAGAIGPRLREKGLELTLADDQWKTFTADEELAETVVDIIRAGGGLLKAFVPKTKTLEDVFLDLVGDPEQAEIPSRPAEDLR